MSLRYGTLPIVRETGGLRDTVTPYNEVDGTGTGFSFTNYNAHEMLAIIRYAKKTYFNDRRAWNEMVLRAMKQDSHGMHLQENMKSFMMDLSKKKHVEKKQFVYSRRERLLRLH